MRIALLLGIILLASPASAAVVDFNVVLNDETGKPYTDCVRWENATVCAESTPLTLGRLAVAALDRRFDDEKNISGVEQVKRGALAMAIVTTPTLDIDSTQNDLIRRLIAKLGTKSTIIYQAWKLLDPASVKDPK